MRIGEESPNLDILRSMAVLFVFGFHLDLFFLQNHYFSSDHVSGLDFHRVGHWGVLMFFVHTSFVLMLSLERQRLWFPQQPLLFPFLMRRVFRILPLSVFMVALVWLLHLPAGDLHGGQFVSAHLGWDGLIANFLLVQNIWRHESIIAVLWSLPYEMQMYLVLPSLYLLVSRTNGVAPILALWVVSELVCSYTGHLDRLGYTGLAELATYVPCFLAGVVAFQISKSGSLNLPAYLWPVAIAVTTIIYLRGTPKPYFCCLMLGLAAPQFREAKNLWARCVAQIIARYSYGIYLTHFICVWLAFQNLNSLPLWARWIVLLVTASLAPFLLYHGLEAPMNRWGGRIVAKLRRSPRCLGPYQESVVR